MENENQLVILIGIGSLVMIILALTLILFYQSYLKNMLKKEKQIEAIEKRKQLDEFKAVVQAEEQQKIRIANNLHDEIISQILLINQNIDLHTRNYSKNRFQIESLEKDREIIIKAVDGIREICLELVPSVLHNYGLLVAIEKMLNQYNNDGTQSLKFENRYENNMSIAFSLDDQVQIYRLFSELLNNLRKYAEFTLLKVLVESKNNSMQIKFMHDGKAVSNKDIEQLSQKSNGLGLKSIKTRTLLLGATLNYNTEGESKITLVVPYSL